MEWIFTSLGLQVSFKFVKYTLKALKHFEKHNLIRFKLAHAIWYHISFFFPVFRRIQFCHWNHSWISIPQRVQMRTQSFPLKPFWMVHIHIEYPAVSSSVPYYIVRIETYTSLSLFPNPKSILFLCVYITYMYINILVYMACNSVNGKEAINFDGCSKKWIKKMAPFATCLDVDR